MNTKFYAKAFFVLICSLVVIGLGFGAGQTGSTSGAKEITLSVTSGRDPGVVDPVANWLYDLPANMFVSLVNYDYVEKEIVPAGATSWSVSDDGMTWTFNIRKNWNWSNGDPVTAKDYEYAFQSIVNPETAAPISWRIFNIVNAAAVNSGDLPVEELGVKAIDDYTLEIMITEPAAWFLSSLTSVGHAVPRETREKYGLEWTRPENIVVNGPYIVTLWDVDDRLVVEKNPSYFDADNVDIEKINLLIVPANSTAMAMYENNELDSATVPPEDLDRVKSDPVLSKEFYNGNQYNFHFYTFDPFAAPMDNVLVRRAFAAAIDKATVAEKITRGGEVPALTLTPPGSFGHIPASEEVGIPFDVAQAKAYLAEAGYPDGKGLPPITLGYNANELNANIAQAIQKMWQDNLGVTVDLKGMEGSAYNESVVAGAFQVHRHGWAMDFPDAHNTHGELFRSRSNTAERRGWVMPEYDDVVDRAAVELDDAKRYELYKQAEKILLEDYAATVPIIYSAINRVTKPRLNRPDAPAYNQSWWLWSIDE